MYVQRFRGFYRDTWRKIDEYETAEGRTRRGRVESIRLMQPNQYQSSCNVPPGVMRQGGPLSDDRDLVETYGYQSH